MPNIAGHVGAAWLGIAAAGHGAAAILLALMAWSDSFPDPTAHAQAATAFALLIYLGFHSALAAVLALFAMARQRAGYVSDSRTLELRQACIWGEYSAGAGFTILAALTLLPELMT